MTKFRRWRDRDYLHYTIEVDGEKVKTWHLVHQTAAIKRIAVGQPVTVAYKPDSPRVAFGECCGPGRGRSGTRHDRTPRLEAPGPGGALRGESSARTEW